MTDPNLQFDSAATRLIHDAAAEPSPDAPPFVAPPEIVDLADPDEIADAGIGRAFRVGPCTRCGHIWNAHTPHPRNCPSCHSAYWDRPRIRNLVNSTPTITSGDRKERIQRFAHARSIRRQIDKVYARWGEVAALRVLQEVVPDFIAKRFSEEWLMRNRPLATEPTSVTQHLTPRAAPERFTPDTTPIDSRADREPAVVPWTIPPPPTEPHR